MWLTSISLAWLALASYTLAQKATTLDWLARDVRRVESVREIKDVTRTFCQLAQFGRWADMASLFAENGVVRVGNTTSDSLVANGPSAIESWLRTDHGEMDGVRPGSLSTWLADQPVTSLAADGLTAKARWLVLRLLGDGGGGTRIQGGVFENEYTSVEGSWKISLLHYYPQFDGDYAEGWGNTGTGSRTLPIIPYHYTPDSAGIPVLAPQTADEPPATKFSAEELSARIARLNEEDEVRNLQHTYGFYVDRRMWSDAADLFAQDAIITADGTRFNGSVRQALERMGPEGLTRGILNDHNLFDTIVNVDANGREATTRGIELGMIGSTETRAATWEFNVFLNRFVKDPDTNLWKIHSLNTTHLVVANYSAGWGTGGIRPHQTAPSPPPFLPISRSSLPTPNPTTTPSRAAPSTSLTELARRLSRSAAFDGAENISGAYGYFADDIRCQSFADLHHPLGHKESPGVGWYRTPERIAQACLARYSTYDPAPLRPRVPFHWRPQPVALVSRDGRSVTYRARLLQWGTSNATRGGFPGVGGFNGAVYHDQMALEDRNGTLLWKLWDLAIDEFYWQSVNWTAGWAAVNPRDPSSPANSSRVDPLLTEYPPDLALTDDAMGEREVGLAGGKPPLTVWPDIRRMWWAFRNPVSGRLPEWYWPGCVPCKARSNWALLENGYQEPPTGPSLVKTVRNGTEVTVSVAAGPEEPVVGVVVVMVESTGEVVTEGKLDGEESVTLEVPEAGNGTRTLVVVYGGSERLKPGQTRLIF
ncbi:Nuclear transport factor 2 family protein [Madurella fahalii]|uniref:Nuclear transport factor 2 family protein n=1 Tax=Madurella fahalii TaxID=1157608 RepID=A0ABQ0GFI9_9PEZI